MSVLSTRSLTPARAALAPGQRAPRVIQIGSGTSLGYRALVVERQRVTLPPGPRPRRISIRYLGMTSATAIPATARLLEPSADEAWTEPAQDRAPFDRAQIPFPWKTGVMIAVLFAILALAGGTISRHSPRRATPPLSASNEPAPLPLPAVPAMPIAFVVPDEPAPASAPTPQPAPDTVEPAPVADETLALAEPPPPIAEAAVPVLAEEIEPESPPSSIRPPLVRTDLEVPPIQQLADVMPAAVDLPPPPSASARRPAPPEKVTAAASARGHRREYTNRRRGSARQPGFTRQLREVLARVF